MSAEVVALLADAVPERELVAGFEEEGVPLSVTRDSGDAVELARIAAARSPLGLGVGGDARKLVLVLAAAPARPYLEADAGAARSFGQATARLAARRPLCIEASGLDGPSQPGGLPPRLLRGPPSGGPCWSAARRTFRPGASE